MTPDKLFVLSHGTDLAHDPVIAARPGEVLVAWTGLFDGRSRIFSARTRRDGNWSAPFLVDDTVSGDCSDAVVGFTPSGRSAMGWISTSGDESHLNFRLGSGEVEEVAASPVRIETPSMAFDETGQPMIAWSEGGAGRFAVVVAQRDEEGSWTRTPVSEGLDSYDIFPFVFGGDITRVYWYSLGGQDFEFRAARRLGSDWQPMGVGALSEVPPNRLPLLYDTEDGVTPGAVWTELLSDGEIVMTFDPRRGRADRIQTLPGAMDARQLDPDLDNADIEPSFTWREETARRSDILVRHGAQLYRVTGFDHMAQPRIAHEGSDGVHLVLISDQVEGGTGQVYWTYLQKSEK